MARALASRSRRREMPTPPHRVVGAIRAADAGENARELLAAAQAARKAKLDAGRVDTVFEVGDRRELQPYGQRRLTQALFLACRCVPATGTGV